MSEIAKTQYRIEVESPNNARLFFGPLARKVRGRWRAANVTHLDLAPWFKGVTSIPEIPGECIWIDLEKREAGCVDLLSDPKNAGLMTKLRNFFTTIGKPGITPKEPIHLRGLDANEIKDFLYWMARAVKAGHAAPVAGSPELPKLEAIKAMPGKRKLNHGYETFDHETLARQKQYEFEVPVKPGRES